MIREEARKARERLVRADAAMSSVEEADALSRKKGELRALAAKISALRLGPGAASRGMRSSEPAVQARMGPVGSMGTNGAGQPVSTKSKVNAKGRRTKRINVSLGEPGNEKVSVGC